MVDLWNSGGNPQPDQIPITYPTAPPSSRDPSRGGGSRGPAWDAWRAARPTRPDMDPFRAAMDAWRGTRPEAGAGHDIMAAWKAQHPDRPDMDPFRDAMDAWRQQRPGYTPNPNPGPPPNAPRMPGNGPGGGQMGTRPRPPGFGGNGPGGGQPGTRPDLTTQPAPSTGGWWSQWGGLTGGGRPRPPTPTPTTPTPADPTIIDRYDPLRRGGSYSGNRIPQSIIDRMNAMGVASDGSGRFTGSSSSGKKGKKGIKWTAHGTRTPTTPGTPTPTPGTGGSGTGANAWPPGPHMNMRGFQFPNYSQDWSMNPDIFGRTYD